MKSSWPWETLGLFVADQWRRIGVTVQSQPQETAQYFAKLGSGDFEAAIDVSDSISNDPTEVLVKFLPGSKTNFSGVKDDTLLSLYDKQEIAKNEDERRALVTEYQKRYIGEVYYIPMFRSRRIAAVAANIQGWRPLPSTVLNQDLGEVWLRP